MIRNSKVFRLLALAGALAPSIFAQINAQYTISTLAGGSALSGPAAQLSLSLVNYLTADSSGNLYFVLQNRVYMVAADGTLSPVAGNGTAGFSGDSGPALSAQLSNPSGLAVDSTGNLYIADAGNARLRKVSSGVITTVAGNGNFGFGGDNGLAIGASFAGLAGLAIDSSNNIFVAEPNSQRIRKISGGIITTVAGSGASGYSGDNGPATSAQFSSPSGVAVDNKGNLFIADSNNYRVRKVAAGIVTTIAGNGTFGLTGDGDSALNAQIDAVSGIALDGSGNLYLASATFARVREVSSGIINTVVGVGGNCQQQTDSVGDGCAAVSATLSGPGAVALDAAGNLYIADTNNYRIRKVAGGVISTLAGNGSFQYSGDNSFAGNAQFGLQDIAVQDRGVFYIADPSDNRIRKVSGGWITTAAGDGGCCFNGDNISATLAHVNPSGVAADSLGTLYTFENTRVRQIFGGIIGTVAGGAFSGFAGDNGLATSALLGGGFGRVAVDGSGNLYIADRANNRVRKVSNGIITTVAGGGQVNGGIATAVSVAAPSSVAVDAAGNAYIPASYANVVYKVSTSGVITTVAGNGSPGFSGDNGSPTAAQLKYPYGVAVNSAGTVLYIADRNNNRIRMVSGGVITTVAGGGNGCSQQTDGVGDGCAGVSALLRFPSSIALDASGNLYIADSSNYRVRKLSGGVISTVAGNGTCCYSGDNGLATSAQLSYAAGVAIDNNNGTLYIGDSENYRVRKVSGGVISTVAGTGAFGYSGDNGTATSAQIGYAYGVAIDGLGNLYIGDASNARIRKVSGGVITTVVGSGLSGYSGDNGPAASAQIGAPYGVAVDGSNNLYIADTSNNRIREVSGGVITTLAGNGFASFSGDGGPATGAQLSGPSGIAVDAAANLYIADNGNQRVRQVTPAGVITTVAGNGTCCFSGDYGPATSAAIFVSSIAADAAGNLYLADPSSSRIRKVSGGVITPIAGNGSYGYSGDGGPATAASLGSPQAVAVDAFGNVYIADAGNLNVRLLTLNPKIIASVSPQSAVVGASAFTLQVNGASFAAGDIVQWNGTALPTTFVNGSLLTASVTSAQTAQAGVASITVNGISNAAAFSTRLIPSWTVTSAHTGNFAQGQIGATYMITVSNATGAPTVGPVIVNETLPSGMTLVSMAGVGWTCPAGGSTCSRSDPLASGSSYSAITVTVNVLSNAPSQVTNQATVSSGGATSAPATDLTNVTCTVAVFPLSPGVPATAFNLTLNLGSGACAWSASSGSPWLTPTVASGTAASLSVTVAANNTGTQRSGTLTVAGQAVTVTQAAGSAQPPTLVSLNPFQGTGLNANLTFVYADPNGWAAIASAEFIVNPRWEPSGRSGGCYLKYAPATGLFTLIGDDGASVAGATAPGSSTNISNGQCSLNAAASSATGSGNNLTIVASLVFWPNFTGQRHIWMQASDYNNLTTNWLVYGVWLPTQTTFTTGSWYRIYDPNSKSYLYSADPNEYAYLGSQGFLQQGISGLTMTGPGSVSGVSNVAFYRVFVAATSSHFWTSDRNEFLYLISLQNAYVGEGVATFIMPYLNAQGQVSPQVTNSIPFYRAAFQGANLHFWTSDPNEYFGTGGEHLPAGYLGEGIASYVFPASGAQFGPPQSSVQPMVMNGASNVSNGAVTPGQVLTISGHRGGRVLLNGKPAQVIGVQGNALRILVPSDLGDAAEVNVEVDHQRVTLTVTAADPALFVTTAYGRGHAQTREQGPVAPGSIVTLYATGLGNNLPLEAHIAGQPAEVVAVTPSATRPGVTEVQLRVPYSVPPADFQPVVLHIGNLFTQPGVSLAIH